MPRNDLIRVRRGTAAEWTAANPVLDAGEPAWDSTAGRFKVGDGETAWADLPYEVDAGGGGGGGGGLVRAPFSPVDVGMEWISGQDATYTVNAQGTEGFVTADPSTGAPVVQRTGLYSLTLVSATASGLTAGQRPEIFLLRSPVLAALDDVVAVPDVLQPGPTPAPEGGTWNWGATGSPGTFSWLPAVPYTVFLDAGTVIYGMPGAPLPTQGCFYSIRLLAETTS